MYRLGRNFQLSNKIFNLVNNVVLTIEFRHNIRKMAQNVLPVKVFENKFSVSDYDIIGFDLDNTLLRYKLTNMMTLEYNVLSKFLIDCKGYSAEHLARPICENIDFIQKGLVLDFCRGNVLRLSPEGTIQRASHGTRLMSKKDIINIYGVEQKWEVSTKFSKDMLVTWNGPLSEKLRTLLDYFDMPSSLAFARIIDTIDKQKGGIQSSYNVWPDVLDGLIDMFSREHFAMNKGGYFPALKANPEMYIHQTSAEVVEWLKKLRQNKKIIFLLTGSHADFASFTASKALGNNWKSLFDVIIFYARKPGFFTSDRPFYEVENEIETKELKASDLKLNGIYSQGNWKDLIEMISGNINKADPKVLYVGDNLIQDVYTPSHYVNCDTIAISEEMLAEGMVDIHETHLDKCALKSNTWGSYFSNDSGKNADPTIWSAVIRNHARICIPNLDVIVPNPLDYKYNRFTSATCRNGFYPARPLAL